MQFVAVGEGQVGRETLVGSGATEGMMVGRAAVVAVGPPISSGVREGEAEVQPAAEEASKRNAKKP